MRRLPENIFPFAINGAGDKFLFDYREGEITEEELEEKSLEEWQSETLDFVCKSFTAFLGLISPRK
ncbi:hypothetical protein [Paenibacillus glacialis]|uniref:hypothetical protein n=1 Tax=Paenibacillus glacialis TaxID=494026 RepID=UPI000AFBE3C0|nr:hypothetical protein [Paenibacillus glacialis]